MTNITKKKIISVLEDVVEEYGSDHKAECVYWDHAYREPVCIAGVAFVKLGATGSQMVNIQDTLGSLNRYNAKKVKPDLTYGYQEPNLPVVKTLEKLLDLTIDADAYEVLAHAQYIQDSHKTWGEALKTATAE
jgi:hypothetical protein